MRNDDLSQSVNDIFEKGYCFLYSVSAFNQIFRRSQNLVRRFNELEREVKIALTDTRPQPPGKQQGYLERSNIVGGFRFTKGCEPIVDQTNPNIYKWRGFLSDQKDIIDELYEYAISPFIKKIGEKISDKDFSNWIHQYAKNTLEIYTYNKEKGGTCVRTGHVDKNILTLVVSPYAEGFWIGNEENLYLPNTEKLLVFAGKKLKEKIPSIVPAEHGTKLKGDERNYNHTSVQFYI